MNVFQFASYREAIRELLLAKKAIHGRVYTFAKMAQACRLRHTYLSAVLKGDGHLNADQVFDACQYLELCDDDYQFVSLLHEYERSVSALRRKRLKQTIDTARQQGLKAENHGKTRPVDADLAGALALYLNPNAPLVHMFLTVKKFRNDPEKIRHTLGLDAAAFAEAIQCCERAGLIKIVDKRIDILRETIHLPVSSPFANVYQSTLRHKANGFMQTHGKSRHYSFVALYSASEETRGRIQSRFLEFINWVQMLTQGTESNNVYQINFDLLRWSDD